MTNLRAIPHDLTSRASFQTPTAPIVALHYPEAPFTSISQPRRVQDRDQWSLNLRDQVACGEGFSGEKSETRVLGGAEFNVFGKKRVNCGHREVFAYCTEGGEG